MPGWRSFFSRLFGSGEAATERPAADVYTGLRQMMLELATTDGSGAEPAIRGLLMEMGRPGAVVTLVALADGTVSLYFSNGGGIIGLGPHEGPRRAAARWLQVAPQFLEQFHRTPEPPLPTGETICFHLLTDRGVLTAEARAAELSERQQPLWPLYFAGQDVITEVRLVHEKLQTERAGPLQRADGGG